MDLQPEVYVPWFGSVIAECVLIGVIVMRKLAGRFPFFFSSIVYDLARQAVLGTILLANPQNQMYFYAYWIAVALEYIFAIAVIYEVFQHAFRPHIRFSPSMIYQFAVLAVLLAIVAVAFLFSNGRHLHGFSSSILVLDRSAEFVRCGLLVLIWVFASELGISWRHHLWGIVLGLGLYSAAGLITAAVDVATGEMCRHWLVPIPHFAYFGATILWSIYFCRKGPDRGPLTPEKVRLYSDLLASLRKAATGIEGGTHASNH